MTGMNAWQRWWQRRQPWYQQRYVVVDCETSGLQAGKDDLLALAWVVVRPPLIDYGQARYHVLGHSGTDLQQSPLVHGMQQRDMRAEQQRPVLEALAAVLQDAVLVAHHSALDWQFLRHAAAQQQLRLQPLAQVDTLQLELRRLQQQLQPVQRGDLTLHSCRQRYQLPDYRAHHALNDAFACAELFLAQAYAIAGSSATALHAFVTK